MIARMALAIALVLAAACVRPALAQDPTGRTTIAQGAGDRPVAKPANDGWGKGRVRIAYGEPRDPQFRPIRERLMKRRVLEQLQQFLSPLRLPRPLLVQIDQCDAEGRPYQPGEAVTVCYEYVARVGRIATGKARPGGMPVESMVVGAFVQAVLHNVALAVFDLLEIPVWGREHDAADKLAGFIMVQFGREVAQKVLLGAVEFFDASDRTWTGSDFASAQSTEAQRLYNYLCIAVGADPGAFKFVVDEKRLPATRARRCTVEFFNLRLAFQKQILPHVDQALLRKVQSEPWLMLDAPK